LATNILVTGVNGDIGRCVVHRALAQGKRVFATVRNEAHIDTFDAHEHLSFLVMHVDDPASVKSAYETLDQQLGGEPLGAVIHCAAIQSPACVEFMDPQHLEQTLRVNTIGSMLVMQGAFPRLRVSGGNLVIASSIWGLVSGPAVAPYAPSKWALEALIQSARCETRGMGFNISSANIGAVKSRMLNAHVGAVEKMMADGPEELRQLYGPCFDKHMASTKQFDSLAISAEKVAERLLKIADAKMPRASYTIGTDARALRIIDSLLPRAVLEKVLAG